MINSLIGVSTRRKFTDIRLTVESHRALETSLERSQTTPHKYRRLIPRETPSIIRATKLSVLAVNSLTREVLYGDQYNLYLVSLLSNSLVSYLSIGEFFKTELSRYTEKRQQDFVSQYALTSLSYLFALERLNIWALVINKRKLVFLSDSLELSTEHSIDTSGVLSCYASQKEDLIFTITSDGKINVWGVEINNDNVKKRSGQSDFEVRLTMKRLIPAGPHPFTKLGVSETPLSSLIAAANLGSELYVYDYQSGNIVLTLLPQDASKPPITAVAIRGECVVSVDTGLVLVVYSLSKGCELIRHTLPDYFNRIDDVMLETEDSAAGLLLLDSAGYIHDYSCRNKNILSSVLLRAAEYSGTSPATADRLSFTATVRPNSHTESNVMTKASRYLWYLDCERSGLRQLWVVYNRSLELIKLTAICHVVPIGYPIKYIRLCGLQRQEGEIACVTDDHDVLVVAQSGSELLFAPSPPSTFKRQSDQEAFMPAYSNLFIEASTFFTISDQGLVRTYDIESATASKDFKLTKQKISALALVPKYPSLGSYSKQLKQDYFLILGNTQGAVKVIEYDSKLSSLSLVKKYAAHTAVVEVIYLPKTRKVVTVGSEGLVKFMLCDEGYEWDTTAFKGTWEDVSTACVCGLDTILLGYHSGMLQSCYFGKFNGPPLIALLEYHRGGITQLAGLKNSNKDAVSADSLGTVVLWNLDNESPTRVFSLEFAVSSLCIFGNRSCESIFVLQGDKILQIHIQAVQLYAKSNLKTIKEFKSEVKAKRSKGKSAKVLPVRSTMDLKMKEMRVTNFNGYLMNYSSEVLRLNSLKTKVQKVRELVSRDVLAVAEDASRKSTTVHEVKDSLRGDQKILIFKRPKRPATTILQQNRLIRERRSAVLSIKRQGVVVPGEFLASTKVTTRMFKINAEPSAMSPKPCPHLSQLTHAEMFQAHQRPKTTTMKDLFYRRLVSRDGDLQGFK
jgi:WD40 repeat protein